MIIESPVREDIPRLRELWREAFGDSDEFLDIFFGVAYSKDRARCLKIDDECAAALYWFDCEYGGGRVAYLYAIATKKAYRGRGLCRELMLDTHRVLAALGYSGACLVPSSEELFRFYEKFGYKTATSVGEIKVSAASTPASLKSINAHDYATLRRAFLPKGSVIQEGVCLNFLENEAELYAGDGFILAASKHGRILRGVELLGSTEHAAGAVTALGCESGVFRVPLGDIPFAMYLPLAEHGNEPPSYFGLAFD